MELEHFLKLEWVLKGNRASTLSKKKQRISKQMKDILELLNAEKEQILCGDRMDGQ